MEHRADRHPSTSWEESVFNQRLQPGQSLIPLPRNAIESVSRLCERVWLKLKQALATPANSANQTGIFEYPKMLRDRLPRDRRSLRKTRNREQRSVAEL